MKNHLGISLKESPRLLTRLQTMTYPTGLRFCLKRPREVGLLMLVIFSINAHAFDDIKIAGATVSPTLNLRAGLQYGMGINYGLGALDDIGERERSVLYLSIKPGFTTSWKTETAEAYGGFSAVLATTTLDGEISGQVARSGDEAFETDHAYFGWRNDTFDLSFGGQEYTVGDGFIVGDGNFNQGGEDGQYWSGSFLSWRNSAILKTSLKHAKVEAFWLRTDRDLGDSRVAGINIETTDSLAWGKLGVLFLEVLEGDRFNLDGIQAWNIRGHDVHLPMFPNLSFFGEWVLERGSDEDGGGRDNDATGWYVEAQYSFKDLPWAPKFNYRYARLSGDEAGTADNEEYRGLFYTIFKRDWDTWYQGEIAGEYHLFNQNQITHMVKAKVFPRERWALMVHYYSHDLEEPHYFATPTSSTDWADEVNVGVEYFLGGRFYGYAGIAWSTPNSAAKEIFGSDDFTVVQSFVSYTF